MKFTVANNPCSTCPYRRDTPRGIWHVREYNKLPGYDENAREPAVAPFLCHCAPDRLCRGWLTVHRESVAVRILQLTGKITPSQVVAKVATPLYASGREACDAGKRSPSKISAVARQAMRNIVRCNVRWSPPREKGGDQ